MWQALQLRIDGLSYRAIADRLGVSLTTAYRHVAAALEKTREAVQESAAELREQELARLDALTSVWHPRALEGDIAAAGMALKISESRRKLMGLDIPVQEKLEVTQALPPALVVELSGHPASAATSAN